MVDPAQIARNIDEVSEGATEKLHEGTSAELNKTGFVTSPNSLNPYHSSVLAGIQDEVHNLERLLKNTGEELTTGSFHIGDVGSEKFLEIKAAKERKREGVSNQGSAA